ncbi:sigma-70 family RNA polymerase sigma factor [Ensifer adhaerens]|uniref:sigma-70 family RNA polymerase sigma factor n=1 Tax=Ensifer adhaerens TaxID=106592 RepID=UPI00132EC8AD|nr:sigma-70 family RNA polymerase sigma factor [Ensifer adhaerens]QHG71499.1 sigma-70 family RNA polymerase sigma factor [Ensifer adhaerens]
MNSRNREPFDDLCDRDGTRLTDTAATSDFCELNLLHRDCQANSGTSISLRDFGRSAPFSVDADNTLNTFTEQTCKQNSVDLGGSEGGIVRLETSGCLDNDDIAFDWTFSEDPETFVARTAGLSSAGVFIVPSEPPTNYDASGQDWNLDLSPAPVDGEGFVANATENRNPAGRRQPNDDHDFLRVQRGRRRSIKQSASISDTRMSVAYDACRAVAGVVLERGFYLPDDLDQLIGSCHGNGHDEHLSANLARAFESAGMPSVDTLADPELLFHAWTDIDADDLARGLEATLSRATTLPGTSRFHLDKHGEQRLLDELGTAKLTLQLETLGSKTAVESAISAVDAALNGLVKPAEVTMRQVVGERDDDDALILREAIIKLRSWLAAGSIMDGKERRVALHAWESLDLTLSFQRKLATEFAAGYQDVLTAARIEGLIFDYEGAANRLVLEHLPFARRFASRNVAAGEELEDVFQVCTIGLFNAVQRFKPHRGHRFSVYSMFWMKQTLTRWRGDEGAIIRIPVHRHVKLAELDLATSEFERRMGASPSSESLSALLRWKQSDVERLMNIPRDWVGDEPGNEKSHGSSVDPCLEDAVYSKQYSQIIRDALVELPQRQAEVIRMRFGLDGEDEMTLEEVGQLFGVTRERIRQLEANALAYLRHPGRIRRLQAVLGM